MDDVYCNTKIRQLENKLVPYMKRIEDFSSLLSETNEKKYDSLKKELASENYSTVILIIELSLSFMRNRVDDFSSEKIFTSEHLNLFKDYSRLKSMVSNYRYNLRDTEPVRFDGDIIITDPCYIRRRDDDDDDYFAMIEEFGMWRDTIYGDWSCSTVNTDTGDLIGEFCADGGMVCVVPLDKVLEYNPDFDYHIQRPFTTTLLKDFHGTVQFIVEPEDSEDEDDLEKYIEYAVHVVGRGNLNFRTLQTGL